MATKVLVVDDEFETVRLLSMLLEMNGYETFTAINGELGLKEARDKSPEVVLLDIMMPDIDGFEVCRRLRADAETAKIAVIMVTAHAAANIEELGKQAGADSVLRKPVQVDTLTSEIKSVLAKRRASS